MSAGGIPPGLRRRIENVEVASNHLRSQLGPDVPAADTPIEVAFRRYGPESREIQLWFAWRTMVELGQALAEVTEAAANQDPAPALAASQEPAPEPAEGGTHALV